VGGWLGDGERRAAEEAPSPGDRTSRDREEREDMEGGPEGCCDSWEEVSAAAVGRCPWPRGREGGVRDS